MRIFKTLSALSCLLPTLAFGAIEIERPNLPRIEVEKTGSLIDISATLVGYDANTMTLSGPVTGTDVTQGWNFFTIAPKSGYVWRTTGLGDAIGFNWRIVSPTGVHDADDLAVDWETTALTGAGAVSTEGTLKCAYVADNARALSLNGVPFALGGNVPTALGGADDVQLGGGLVQSVGWTNNDGEGGSTDFLLMARSGYAPPNNASILKANVKLNNLTPGHRYLVQILSHDGHNPDRRMSADDADWRCLGGTGDYRGKYGCSFVGRFTAAESSFTFPLRSDKGWLVINAIQVRDLGAAPAAKTARVPVASPSLVYDGTALRGVADGVGYTVANAKATDAGIYTATATLDAGYAWADGYASASRAVSFTIHPADNAITYFRPKSFAADAPKPNDPMIRVTGGTPVFRYCSDEAGQHEVAMNGSEQPGTYYVFATVPEGNYKSVSTNGVVTVKPAGWKGPKVAIVGDSYSTFAGAPGNGAIHYPGTKNDILELTQTWWWQVIEGISGASLQIDLAYAGSELKGGKNVSGVSFVDRINKSGLGTLGADDIILVCGGLNDVMLWVDAGIPVSTETMYDHADTVCKLINAKYPSVKRKIFVGQNLLQNYNNKGTNYLVPIRQACEANEWVFVNTASVLGPQGYAPNMHWGIDGARMVSRQVLSAYDDCEKNGYPADLATQAKLPTVKAGLVYTGEEQTGVSGGKGCTLEGTLKATDADTYTVTAVLNAGCTWADGSTAARRTLTWTIAKATNEWVQKPTMSKTTWALDYAGTVTVAAGSSKWGAPTATYATGSLPKSAGTYRNVFTVAEAKNWTGLEFEIPFTVNAAGGETDPDIVAKPTLAKTKFDFSGNPIDVTAQLSSTANVTLSGDTVRTEAGSYTLIVSPAKGYAWNDGTTAALSFVWRIVKPTNAVWTKESYDPKTWTPSENNLVKGRTPTLSQNADKAARLVDGDLPGETFDANKVVVFNAATYSLEWTFDAPVKIDRINFFSRSNTAAGEAMIQAKSVLVKYEGETEWTNLEVVDEGGVLSYGSTARLLSVAEEGGLAEGVIGLRLVMIGGTDLKELGYTTYSYKSTSQLAEVEVIGSMCGEPVTPKATVPTAKSGLVYTGAAQTGVAVGTGFTLEGNSATDIAPSDNGRSSDF